VIGGATGTVREAGPSRVLCVAAAAVARALQERSGVTATEPEALSLAALGPAAAVDLVERLRRTPRRFPGVDAVYADRLLLAEAIAEARGVHRDDPGARAAMLAGLAEELRTRTREVERARSSTAEVERLLSGRVSSEPRLRWFLRQVARMRSDQLVRLREGLGEGEALDATVGRLDSVYARGVTMAMS
jgi:hypothetical protein